MSNWRTALLVGIPLALSGCYVVPAYVTTSPPTAVVIPTAPPPAAAPAPVAPPAVVAAPPAVVPAAPPAAVVVAGGACPPVPAFQPETTPLPPVSPEQLTWEPGHWDWNGSSYVWSPGRWVPLDGH